MKGVKLFWGFCYVLMTMHPCIILWIKPTWCTVFLSMLVSFLYMFRVTVCPSSGEVAVSVRHLVFVALCGWLSGMQGGIPPCIPDSYRDRVTNTKCRIDTVISADDVEKRSKHSKKSCAPSWLFFLQCFEDLLVVLTIIGQTVYPCPVKCNYSRLKWTTLSRAGPGMKNNSGLQPLLWDWKAGWHRLNYTPDVGWNGRSM